MTRNKRKKFNCIEEYNEYYIGEENLEHMKWKYSEKNFKAWEIIIILLESYKVWLLQTYWCNGAINIFKIFRQYVVKEKDFKRNKQIKSLSNLCLHSLTVCLNIVRPWIVLL